MVIAPVRRSAAAYPAYRVTRARSTIFARANIPCSTASGTSISTTRPAISCRARSSSGTWQLLRDHLLGNPHSTNPASALATTFVEQTRLSVLDFFNADPDEYVVIFTANATQALKLVGEAYPFDAGGEYLLTFDNHNSVNGIREFARARGCPTTYVPIVLPDMRVDETELRSHLARGSRGGHRLFAYPAQSNFSGVQHPLDWIPLAQEHGWDVLLDAAAFTPTNRLDLGRWKPDFVSQSFYKMFGYPTGVGCLIARKTALAKLRRPVVCRRHHYRGVGSGRQVLSRGRGVGVRRRHAQLSRAAGGRVRSPVSVRDRDRHDPHASALSHRMADRAAERASHTDGAPLARIYGPRSDVRRGGTVTFNFYDRDGRAIDHRDVEQRANASNISLRTGCFCNPGGGEIALGITGTELSSCFHQPEHETHLTIDDFRLCIDGKSTGAVRVSLGLASNVADVEAFIRFAEAFLS